MKATQRPGNRALKGLREIQKEHGGVGRRVLVCREQKRRLTEDGIEILPVRAFLERLWDDAIL